MNRLSHSPLRTFALSCIIASSALFSNVTFSQNNQSSGGDGQGISCQFKMYLDSGYTVAVLSNYSRPAANIVGDVAHQMIAAQ
ncbi:hypothetical protein ACFL47_06200 [Candidatus Latescibacterota bacterium]